MPRRYTNYRKTSKTPRKPFDKDRLLNELKIVGAYGLRNKREVWRVQLTLAKLRKAARQLLTLDATDPRRLFEGDALIRRIVKLGKNELCSPCFSLASKSVFTDNSQFVCESVFIERLSWSL